MRRTVAAMVAGLIATPAAADDGDRVSRGARAVLDAFRAASEPTAGRLSAAEAEAVRDIWLGRIGAGRPAGSPGGGRSPEQADAQ